MLRWSACVGLWLLACTPVSKDPPESAAGSRSASPERPESPADDRAPEHAESSASPGERAASSVDDCALTPAPALAPFSRWADYERSLLAEEEREPLVRCGGSVCRGATLQGSVLQLGDAKGDHVAAAVGLELPNGSTLGLVGLTTVMRVMSCYSTLTLAPSQGPGWSALTIERRHSKASGWSPEFQRVCDPLLDNGCETQCIAMPRVWVDVVLFDDGRLLQRRRDSSMSAAACALPEVAARAYAEGS
jgi:hypothetical protein